MRYLIKFTLVVLILVSCTPKKEYMIFKGFTQGTTYSISYLDSLNRDFSSQIDSILSRIDQSMSIYNDSSTISKINNNISGSVDFLLKEVITYSYDIYMQTDGAFDITVGPVVKAIGFGKGKTVGIDSTRIKQLLPLIGMHQIHLEGNTLLKNDSRIQIDVNAIAQGYTVDLIGKYLEQKGVKHYLVEVGGEITARGKNSKGTDWVVGIDRPVESALPGENLQAKITLSNGQGLATSGNYRKFIEVNGQKYAHTINPKTGFPELNNLLSATVVASSATKADALATAFMVKGLEWSKNFVANSNDIDAYLIYSDSLGNFLIWMNEGMKKRIIP